MAEDLGWVQEREGVATRLAMGAVWREGVERAVAALGVAPLCTADMRMALR